MAKMFGLRIGNVDVTQAFLQSDTAAFADRQIICLPGYIEMQSGNKVLENGARRNVKESDFGLGGMETGQRKQQLHARTDDQETPLWGPRCAATVVYHGEQNPKN